MTDTKVRIKINATIVDFPTKIRMIRLVRALSGPVEPNDWTR